MGTDHQPAIDANDHAQRKVLLWVLVLNAGLGVTLLIGGLASDSSSLIANSLDNFSDAVAYAVSFLAVTRGARWKAAAAAITGVMLLLLAGGVIVDALRRFVSGSEPLGMSMMMLAAVAVAINVLCVKLLRSHRGEDVNLRAAWTMSLNDFVCPEGTCRPVVGGVLTYRQGSHISDTYARTLSPMFGARLDAALAAAQ